MFDPFRKHPRIHIEIPAKLSVPGQGESDLVLHTRQLGRGGCMLKSQERITAPHTVNLTLELASKSVAVVSEIIYEHFKDGYWFTGFQFKPLATADQQTLDGFMAVHLHVL